MTNYIRRLLFGHTMSLVNLIMLLVLVSNLRFWIALPVYLVWSWILEPHLEKLVGATPADLAAQAADRNKSGN